MNKEEFIKEYIKYVDWSLIPKDKVDLPKGLEIPQPVTAVTSVTFPEYPQATQEELCAIFGNPVFST